MKISKRDINLLLVVLGLIIFGVSYYFIANNFKDLRDITNTEISTIQPEYDQLQIHISKQKEYIAKTREYQTSIRDMLIEYPSKVTEEEYLVWIIDWAEKNNIDVNSATVEPEVQLDTFKSYVLGENAEFVAKDITTGTMRAAMTTVCDYNDLKNAVNEYFVDKTQLNLVSLSYNNMTGFLDVTFDTSKHFITWEDAPYDRVDMPSTTIGQHNLFGTGELEQIIID